MSFLDQFSNTVTTQANTSISQVRGTTARRLTNLIAGALPGTNKIPGATGGLIQREITKRIGDGVNQVLDVLDIRQYNKTQTANPKIYNNGVAAARGVWQQIDNGSTDVPRIVASSLEPLTLLKYTDLQHEIGDNVGEIGQTNDSAPAGNRYSPYAMDLFRYAPKHKFLFVVEFIFNGDYAQIGKGNTHQNEFALVVKDFERPKIKYEYEPDVNYYNFRTPIIKRVVHEPLTLKFLDDRQNVSMKFFHEYLKATHPVTAVAPESSEFYEDNGMNWNSPLHSASSGVLANNLRTIIKEIKVYHLYDFGAHMNVYHFMNPKIVEMNLDNWNMHESEGSELSASFGYDATFIEMGIKVTSNEDAVISTLSNAGQYPLHPMQVAGRQVDVQPSRVVNPQTPLTRPAAMGSMEQSGDEIRMRDLARNGTMNNKDRTLNDPLNIPTPDYDNDSFFMADL